MYSKEIFTIPAFDGAFTSRTNPIDRNAFAQFIFPIVFNFNNKTPALWLDILLLKFFIIP